jgi:hypothetical protein
MNIWIKSNFNGPGNTHYKKAGRTSLPSPFPYKRPFTPGKNPYNPEDIPREPADPDEDPGDDPDD